MKKPRPPHKDKGAGSKKAKLKKLSEASAAESALERSLKKYHRKMPTDQAATMHNEVRKLFHYKAGGHDPEVFWQKVINRESRFEVRKHKESYVQALAEALKVYEYICGMPLSKFVEHVKALSSQAGVDPTKKKFNLLRLVLMFVIDYTCKLKKNKLGIHAHDLSRDVKALEWLTSKGLQSDKLVAYQRKYGGGVDKWSRLASKNSSGEIVTATKSDGKRNGASSGQQAASTSGAADGSHGSNSGGSKGASSSGSSTPRSQSTGGGSAKSGVSARDAKPKRDDVLGAIVASYDLEPNEDLVLHLRGTYSKPFYAVICHEKLSRKGKPWARRIQASRLSGGIRKVVAREAQRRNRG